MDDPAKTIGALHRELEEARAQIAAYRGVADNSSDYIMRYDRTGRHVYANRAALEVTGLAWDRFVGKTHAEMGYPRHLCELWETGIEQVFETGETLALEFEVDLVAGATYLELKLHPEFDDAGRVVTVLGVSRDVTERRRSADRLRLVARELDHRVKNNLAGIIALMHETASFSSSLDQFVETFGGRLEAMGRVHEMLAREAWTEIDLAELVDTTISQFVADPSRVTRVGPSAPLAASVALPFAMALHEVAINAAKHGALSHPDGRLRVAWEWASGRDRLRLTWTEEGCEAPCCDTPGLGMELIEGLVRHEIGGEAECEPTADGIVWRFELPLPLEGSGR